MPARSSRTPSRSPPQPICSGRPSACAAASSASRPAGISRTRWASRSKRAATSVAGPLVSTRKRAREALLRPAPRPPAGAATPRCRRPRSRCRPGRERCPPARARRACAPPTSSSARRRVAAQVGVGQEAASRTANERRPLDAAGERPDGDLGRAAAHVDDRDAPRQRPSRACASRPGRPAAPPPRPSSTHTSTPPCSRMASQNSSRLAARRITAVATARMRRARRPARRARAARPRRPRSRRSAPPESCPPGARPRPRRVNARRCRTSVRPPVARLGDQHAGGVRPDIDAAAEHSPARDVAMMEAMTSGAAAIEVRGLTKAYGLTRPLRGIDFTVARGEVFGLLGPNGAGKTTTRRGARGLPRARQRDRVACWVTTPGTARRSCARASGSCCRAAAPTRI